MADIKINHATGEIALPQASGGFRIYRKGEYKFNEGANQFAVPDDSGGWQVHAAPPGAVKQSAILPMSELPTGDYQFDINAGIPGAVIRGFKGPGDAAMGNIPPDQMEARAAETAGLMAGGPGLVGRAPSTMGRMVKGTAEAPTVGALKEAADTGYNAARGMGVDFEPTAVKSWADDTIRKFEGDGFNEVNNPATWKILNDFLAPPAEPGATTLVNFNGLVAARRALQDVAGNFQKPSDQRWASMAIDAIDNFLENPPPASVAATSGVSGAVEAGQAGKLYQDANANYSAAKRAEALAGKQERAIDRAGATNSGANLDNQVRQRIDEIIARPKEGRGFTEEEIALLREASRGTFGSNIARIVGNALGGGGGLGGILSAAVGASAVGPAGAAAPLLGYAAKRGSAALTNRQINSISDLTRKRSPLYDKMKGEAKNVPGGDSRTEALIRAMILYDSSKPWLQEQQGQSASEARARLLREGT